MGNCIQTCVQRQRGIAENGQYEQESALEKAAGSAGAGNLLIKENMSKESSSMRIKMVLTKEELAWLLIHLKNKEGQRLEDVLEEIERGRRRTVGWKPSLESITESPAEVPEQMSR